MDKGDDRAKTFTRRAFIIGAAQGLFLSVLGGRLAWLQVVQGGHYKILSENNRINVKMIAPSRGQIVDRFGVPLAVNNQNFRVLIVPEQIDDISKVLQKLSAVIDLDEKSIQKVLSQAKKSAGFVPLEVRDDLSWEDVAKIEVNLVDLPGISTEAGEIRNYPFKEATAHIVGYVGAVNKAELTGDPVFTLPGFQIGKTGIEKAYDTRLRGTSGTSEMEVNVIGREVRELKNNEEKQGERISLSIDAELQRYTQQRLSETRSSSAVIMDAHSGALYASCSHPGFDPNLFTRGISAENWEELLAESTHPLTNKAIAGQYPPGSTFKMVTALAALEAGVIHAGTRVFCPGHYEYGKDRFHCWKRTGHGSVDLVGALMQSCDTFFYKLSTDLGIEKIAEMAHRLGLGQKIDFELSEERPGLIPDKKWKLARFGESWQPGETIVASIGQGYLLSTPLQLAVMTGRLINGGQRVKPWLVTPPSQSEGKQESLNIDPAHLKLIKRGMDGVVNRREGTAYAARITEQGMEMGGKTGTAQVKRITREERRRGIKNETLPWHFQHHALFVGYAPIENPRYVCSVVVEHGGGGSAVAAPIARDLLLRTQIRNPASDGEENNG